MAIYRVSYSSMTATYGPSFIEAESEDRAKLIFARRGAFSQGEAAVCIKAREVSQSKMIRALQADRER